MRRALACTLWAVVVVGGCGYPDFGFAPGPSHTTTDASVSAGGASATIDGSVDSGIAGHGGGGAGQGGSGGVGGTRLPDAAPDAPVRECTVNADCAASPGGPYCAPDGRCVECGAGFPACAVGTRCTSEGLCEPGCDVDRDCVEVASLSDGGAREAGLEASVPDATTDARVPGTTPDARAASRDAAGDAPGSDGGPHLICETSSHTCIGCATDSECPPGASCDAGRCVPVCNSARPCPTGFSCCGGACFSDRHSAEHCGGCGVSCGTDGGRGACVAGKCREDLCTEGRGDCNNDATDGCETDLFDDPRHCGNCKSACLADNASAVCHHGECAFGTCNPGYANCDGLLENACEVSLGYSTPNCGTCGFACNLLNANQRCNKSVCELTTCKAGYADCDKLTTTGCEVNTQSNPSNCGACGNVCSFPNADATCSNGKCQLKTGGCIAPFQNCNGVASDGCEINLDSDPDNCGICATHCVLANATAGCAGGACIVASCNNGFADCDSNPANGCETNLSTSAKNCGACGTPCSTNHGAATCALSACSIQCANGFQDCDADATNGCEIQTATNVDNCGTCNKACPTLGGTAHCLSGVCGISTCSGTLADCNGSPGDGCEVDTATNVGNCGGCGKACFTQNGTADCIAGQCVIKSCATGFKDCNSDDSDGCETRLNTVGQCGDCNVKCILANANETCLAGCDIASCISPYADCDAKPTNGCEIDTSSDVNNCGACSSAVSGGAACDATNGTPRCVNGSCAITCNAGFANCNALVSDGCERSTRNDVNNCGACGAVCAVQNGKAACNVTTCVVQSCTAPFADCDHAYATGCETNTDTRIDACGACGHVCDTSKGTPTCTAGVCILPP